VTREDVFVATGLFTVGVDFGAVFGGQRRFLEVGVRPGASTGAYDVLSGRHELSAAPSALFGASAPWAGVTGKPAGFADDVDNDFLAGLVCSNGLVLKSNGTSWFCGSDLNTTYTGGAGIQVSGTTISIFPLSVTAGMLANDSVIAAKMGDNAVGNAEMLDNAVGNAEMADNAVGNAEMLDNAIGTVELQNGAVTAAKIGVGAVGQFQLAGNAVNTANIVPDSVTSSRIAPNTVNTDDIATNAITRAELAGTEVTIYQMASGCANGGTITLAFQCITGPCGGGLFETCAGNCTANAPQVCANPVLGFLLGATIP
jgi:hypothetical protein